MNDLDQVENIMPVIGGYLREFARRFHIMTKDDLRMQREIDELKAELAEIKETMITPHKLRIAFLYDKEASQQ